METGKRHRSNVARLFLESRSSGNGVKKDHLFAAAMGFTNDVQHLILESALKQFTADYVAPNLGSRL